MFVRVAINTNVISIDKLYTYKIPDDCEGIRNGTCVIVPFGTSNRPLMGIILKISESASEDEFRIKTILSVFDEKPLLNPDQVRLAIWMREQYYCTFFDALRTMIPPGIIGEVETAYCFVGDKGEWERILQAGLEDSSNKTFTQTQLKSSFGNKWKKAVGELLNDPSLFRKEYVLRQQVTDKFEKHYYLQMMQGDAESLILKSLRNPAYLDVIDFISLKGHATAEELIYYTGCNRYMLSKLTEKGVIFNEKSEIYRTPYSFNSTGEKQEIVLNDEQNTAYDSMVEEFNGDKMPVLLYGVTGSGKTNVYIRFVQYVVAQSKTAIVLVPEISLTQQVIKQFYTVFGNRVAVLHSRLSNGERYDEWKRIRKGEIDVVVGTRSAVFAPLQRLGTIIIDDEQEGSYKSEITPKYHTKEIAQFRCMKSNAELVFCSATPSVCTFYEAEQNKICVQHLTKRVAGAALPEVIISDLKQDFSSKGIIKNQLRDEIGKNLAGHEQTILLLNRRGNSKKIVCLECGHVISCPNCSVALHYHSANQRLLCHHCGHSQRVIDTCPNCHSKRLSFHGAGTQKIEDELALAFPNAKILRMDADTTIRKNAHERILNKFETENYDILLGTQMVAKGLDFERVTLVGILDADASLYNENYLSNEETFSLITQMIGRSGRREKRGRAVIQTYNPEHPAIRFAIDQDYKKFYDYEIKIRESLNYPPFSTFAQFVVSSEDEKGALASASALSTRLTQLLKGQFRSLNGQVLGPIPCVIYKMNSRYRYVITVRTQLIEGLKELLRGVLMEFHNNNGKISLSIDVNPVDAF